MGAWIETCNKSSRAGWLVSHPTWVRGLKHEPRQDQGSGHRHQVAPYMGAWIETFQSRQWNSTSAGRTLHGCVD